MTSTMANATLPETVNAFGNSGLDSSDAIWTLFAAFLIFTMQSGFALLESGMVSRKNEANIMVKNVVDICVGGLAYWAFGFAFAFGDKSGTNGFTGVGYFFTDFGVDGATGVLFAKFVFQLSFATTATTIVSGAVAERVHLPAYILFSFTNVLSYVFPAHWIWAGEGWLFKEGVIDIAGSCVVHMVGGASAFVAAIMLGPRHGRFDESVENPPLASPTNVILGTFMLWWGWNAFNCGSTWGVSGGKWKLASRAATVTMVGAAGGGIFAMFYSYVIRRKKFKGKLDIPLLSAGILAGLVGITAICAVTSPWEGFIIGILGGAAGIGGIELMEKVKIDDPVGCIGVHWFGGVWGMIAVAFFTEEDKLAGLAGQHGIFRGGRAKLLGVQLAAIVTVTLWSAVITLIQLVIYKYLLGIRMSLEDELAGADLVEHGIGDYYAMEGTHAFGRHVTPSQNGIHPATVKSDDSVKVIVNPAVNGSFHMEQVNNNADNTKDLS